MIAFYIGIILFSAVIGIIWAHLIDTDDFQEYRGHDLIDDEQK